MKELSVVIIGGSGPFGSVTALEFLKAGASVAVSWNTLEGWEKIRPKFQPYKDRLFEGKVDVTDEVSVSGFITQALERFGKIDVLLYMAGYFHIGPMIWETKTEVFDKLCQVNLRGAFLACKAAIPIMLEQEEGRIFFFPAKSVEYPKPRFGAYAVSKSGLVHLAEALAEELKESNITVNCLMPDAVDTYKTRMAPNATPDKWIKPEQIAKLLIALCSTEDNILNGATLTMFGK